MRPPCMPYSEFIFGRFLGTFSKKVSKGDGGKFVRITVRNYQTSFLSMTPHGANAGFLLYFLENTTCNIHPISGGNEEHVFACTAEFSLLCFLRSSPLPSLQSPENLQQRISACLSSSQTRRRTFPSM